MHEDVARHPRLVYGSCGDLAETQGWGLRIFISLTDVSLSIRDFYDNIKVSWWEAVTTGYLDPNAYKKVRVRLLAR